MYLAVQLVVGLSEMARKAKDKRFFFFFFGLWSCFLFFWPVWCVYETMLSNGKLEFYFAELLFKKKKKSEEVMPQRCVAYKNLKCILLSPLKTMFANPWWRWKWSRSVMSYSLRPPRTVAYEAPPSMEFPRQEYWKTAWVCHFHLQGIFLTHGSNPGLPHCKQMLLPSTPGICY